MLLHPARAANANLAGAVPELLLKQSVFCCCHPPIQISSSLLLVSLSSIAMKLGCVGVQMPSHAKCATPLDNSGMALAVDGPDTAHPVGTDLSVLLLGIGESLRAM